MPTSDATYYVNGARHGERLTFAPGRNAYDGTAFDPREIRFGDLVDGIYARHGGGSGRGSLLCGDGRHIAVPHVVGKLFDAARIAGRSGTALLGGGAAAAALVALGGTMPSLTLGVAGTGAGVKVAAWAAQLVGRGAVAGAVREAFSEARSGIASLERTLDAERSRTDAMVDRLRGAASIMRASVEVSPEVVDEAREAAGYGRRSAYTA